MEESIRLDFLAACHMQRIYYNCFAICFFVFAIKVVVATITSSYIGELASIL